jgi:L-fuconolactonase
VRIDSFQSFTADHPPEHLGPILARNRFDGSIAVEENPADPRELLALIRHYDFVKAAIPAVDLTDPDLALLLAELAHSPKFRGVFHKLGDSIPTALAELARRDLSLDLLLSPGQLPVAAEIAIRLPGLPMAIVHLGSPGLASSESDDWARDIAALARFPQIFCKASGLAHLTRLYVQHVLAAFSPFRVMFGSGWPAGLPDHIWKESLAAFTQSVGAQPIEVREELLGGVAQRFYRIG